MKCCDLTAGKLRHIIAFERKGRAPDGAGGSAVTWVTVATASDVRAWVKPTTGNERLMAQRTEANITHRIYARYRDDILTSDRINFGGRLMQVKAIINIEEMNRWIEIHAIEGEAT